MKLPILTPTALIVLIDCIGRMEYIEPDFEQTRGDLRDAFNTMLPLANVRGFRIEREPRYRLLPTPTSGEHQVWDTEGTRIACTSRSAIMARNWCDAANAAGIYSPELAESYREAARGLLQCDLGDKIDVPHDAAVSEGPGDGVFVTVQLYVSDADRADYEDDGEPAPRAAVYVEPPEFAEVGEHPDDLTFGNVQDEMPVEDRIWPDIEWSDPDQDVANAHGWQLELDESTGCLAVVKARIPTPFADDDEAFAHVTEKAKDAPTTAYASLCRRAWQLNGVLVEG